MFPMATPEAHILVVDDEELIQLTLQAILQEDGYRVDVASDGAKAIESIRACHYDLVITDLKMPGVSGLDVLREVQQRSPTTVTIMMTGYGSVASALEAVHLGAYEYLLKPTPVEEFKLAVRRSLERKRLSETDSLYRVTSAVTASFDKQRISAEVESAARDVLRVDSAQLISLNRNGEVQVDGALGALFSDRLVRGVLEQGICLTDQECAPGFRQWAGTAEIASFVIVPGLANGRLACLLIAHNGREKYDFHASSLRFLKALAMQAGMALSNAALFAQIQQNNLELESANRRLRELDRLRNQFLSIATHELRTPLTLILGYNSMISESLENRATREEKELLEESVAACQRLIRMVNSMLDLTQIEAGKMKMEFTSTDLPSVVRTAVGLFQGEAAKKGISLELKLPTRMPPVLLDGDRIEQVIINLVGNAMKFTDAGGVIQVEVRYQPDAEITEISVRDTGVGIAAADQEVIFDEFAQVQKNLENRHREGTGLGLAIVKRIVDAHAGNVRVESAPGSGSTFTVILPTREPQLSSISAVSAL